jgi:hypothetical protein
LANRLDDIQRLHEGLAGLTQAFVLVLVIGPGALLQERG